MSDHKDLDEVQAQPHGRAIRVLVTGATGQVGQAFLTQAAQGFECVGVGRQQLDLADLSHLAQRLEVLLQHVRPDYLVNAAAYTAVDQAEEQVQEAWCVNAVAPGIMAAVAARHGIPFVHYSTDYVFDGQSERAYRESDDVNPLSVYGRSKLAGESAVAGATPTHLILRTSWVYSAFGNNFLKTMLRLGATHETLRVVCDQTGIPTSAHWIAQATLQILAFLYRQPESARPWGTYNLTAQGTTSWHDYASYIFERARQLGLSLRLEPQGLQAIATHEYPTAATRPVHASLDTDLLQQTFGIAPPCWRTGVDQVLETLSE